MLRRLLATSSRPLRWAHQMTHQKPPPYVRKHVAALTDPLHASVDALSVDHNFHGGQGTIVRHSLLNEHSRQASTLQLWTICVGATEGMHVHGGPGSPKFGALEELYVCLEGRGTINVQHSDDAVEDVPFESGDAVVVQPGVWHGVTNTGSTSLRLLIMWGPPASDGVTARERDQLLP